MERNFLLPKVGIKCFRCLKFLNFSVPLGVRFPHTSSTATQFPNFIYKQRKTKKEIEGQYEMGRWYKYHCWVLLSFEAIHRLRMFRQLDQFCRKLVPPSLQIAIIYLVSYWRIGCNFHLGWTNFWTEATGESSCSVPLARSCVIRYGFVYESI